MEGTRNHGDPGTPLVRLVLRLDSARRMEIPTKDVPVGGRAEERL